MNGPDNPYWRTDPQRERCGYASKYKAEKAPTCGCKACEKKWYEKSYRKQS